MFTGDQVTSPPFFLTARHRIFLSPRSRAREDGGSLLCSRERDPREGSRENRDLQGKGLDALLRMCRICVLEGACSQQQPVSPPSSLFFFSFPSPKTDTHHHTPSPPLLPMVVSSSTILHKARVKGWYHAVWRNSNLPDTRARTSQPRRKNVVCLMGADCEKKLGSLWSSPHC